MRSLALGRKLTCDVRSFALEEIYLSHGESCSRRKFTCDVRSLALEESLPVM